MGADTIQQDAWRRAHEQIVGVSKTETAQQSTFAGFADLIKDLEVKPPEQMLKDAADEIIKNFNETIKPHSPLTPEEGFTTGMAFLGTASAAHAAFTALATGLEAAGLGQLEVPAIVGIRNPSLQATWNAARAVLEGYYEAAFVKGAKYKANFDHTPTIIPEEALISAYNMDIIDEVLYTGQMAYHGYTPERSLIIAASQIRMPDIAVIIELLRRGVLSPDGAVDWLMYQRIPADTAIAMVKIAEQVPEPYRLADMMAKNRITKDVYNTYMGWHGLNEVWADRWAETQITMPTLEQLITMVNRGLADEKVYMETMLHSGYELHTAAKLLGLKDVIPPIGDLIRFAVREAFPVEPGLPQFKEMERYAGLQGLTPFWVDKYWWAHFTRMSLTTAYENVYRGLFDKGTFEHYLLINDIHLDDWDAIWNVRYRPPNVRELGYGFDVGVYTKDDIAKYRRWGGLSPEDAEKAAAAMVAYRSETERNAVRTELVYAYGRGKYDLATLKKQLEYYKTPPHTMDMWIDRAVLYKERLMKPELDTEGKITSSSEAITAFKLLLRDDAWLREHLKALDWTDDRIQLAVEKALYDITEDAEKAAKVTYRNLTVAQIVDMYELKLIGKEQMTALFVKIGYSEADAKLLTTTTTTTKLEVVKPRLATISQMQGLYDIAMADPGDIYDTYIAEGYAEDMAEKLTVLSVAQVQLPNAKARYSNGWISEDELYSELLMMGIPSDRANLLMEEIVKYSKVNRTVAERELTKAEIIKGYKSQVLTTAEAAELLMGLGYDEYEARYLLAINTIVKAGDPQSYMEMKKVVELYKKAQGEPYMEISDELVKTANEIQAIRAELMQLRKIGVDEKRIAELALQQNALEIKYRELLKQR